MINLQSPSELGWVVSDAQTAKHVKEAAKECPVQNTNGVEANVLLSTLAFFPFWFSPFNFVPLFTLPKENFQSEHW